MRILNTSVLKQLKRFELFERFEINSRPASAAADRCRPASLNPLRRTRFAKSRRGEQSRPQTLSQKGSALVITLLILTILAALTVEFAYEVFISTSSFSNWSNAQKASLAAKSGQVLSSEYIKEMGSRSYTYPGEIMLPSKYAFGDNTILIIKIEDETAKFNINSIIYQNGLTNEDAMDSLKKLLEYLNINKSLATTVADWIDPDHEPRITGSEENAKNSFLWNVSELILIDGVDEEIFELLKPYITVYGERGEININTAKLPVLISLHNDMTETLAKKIIDYRDTSPFEARSDLQLVSGMETIGNQILPRITVKSLYYRVVSQASVDEIIRIVETVISSSLTVQFWREG